MKMRCPECEAAETDMSNKGRRRPRDLLWGIVGFVVGCLSYYELVEGGAISPLLSLLGTIGGFGGGIRYAYRGIISLCRVSSPKIKFLVMLLIVIPPTVFLSIPYVHILFPSGLPPFIPNPKVTIARAMMAKVENALYIFQHDCGRLPSESEGGLSALVDAPPSLADQWDGPYLKRHELLDLWGHPYFYSPEGEHDTSTFDLLSFGADGQKGGKGENADLIND